MKKTTVSILALLLVIGMAACQHKVNTTPQVAYANTLLDAATASDVFSLALRGANDAVIKIRPTEPDYYTNVHPWLVRLAQLNDKALADIALAKAGDASVDWRQDLAEIAKQGAMTDPAVFGFKNANSQAAVRIGFASLELAINSLAASFPPAGK